MSPQSLQQRVQANIFSRFREILVIKKYIYTTQRPELLTQMLTSLVVTGKGVFQSAVFH